MHLQVWGEEEKGRNTRTLASRVGRGEARRRMQAHDIRVNGLPKSISKPRRYATSFCSLFLLHDQCIFNMEAESVTGFLNPMWFSSINTRGYHANHN
jgi:hypothetical protein